MFLWGEFSHQIQPWKHCGNSLGPWLNLATRSGIQELLLRHHDYQNEYPTLSNKTPETMLLAQVEWYLMILTFSACGVSQLAGSLQTNFGRRAAKKACEIIALADSYLNKDAGSSFRSNRTGTRWANGYMMTGSEIGKTRNNCTLSAGQLGNLLVVSHMGKSLEMMEPSMN